MNLLLKTFFVFRAVITEEFKVPDKMVGFSKYPGALSLNFCLLLSVVVSQMHVTCGSVLGDCGRHCGRYHRASQWPPQLCPRS